jgi:hypothetical protein
MSRARKLILVALACGGLVACGEPSESDMKGAVEKTFATINGHLGGMGKLIGKDLTTKVLEFKKLGCAKAEDGKSYACDFEMTVDGPLGKDQQKAKGRFVKGDAGWTVAEN